MSKQKSAVAPPVTTAAAPASAVASATPEQDGMGNSALQDGLSSGDSADSTWFSSLVADEMTTGDDVDKGKGLATELVGDEVGADPPEGIVRSVKARVGQSGAVLGASPTHEVRSKPDPKESASSTIPDGTPVTVLSVADGFVQVEWNVGDKKESGWVAGTVFSPQPKLNTKDQGAGMMYKKLGGDAEDHSTTDRGDALTGEDVKQGGLADCFFIAAMNAVGNASPKFLQDAVKFDASTGLYTVRFKERAGFDPKKNEPTFRDHFEVVDGYLPTLADGRQSYARANGPSAWGPIYEKAYAQWKGGYDKLGTGGNSGEAMTALTGKPSIPKSTSGMKAADVIPFFEKAKASGTAVVCGSLDSMQAAKSAPLSGSGAGPYTGTITTGPSQSIKQGTVQVTDKSGKVSPASDAGAKYPDKTGTVSGSDVKAGSVDYGMKSLTVSYKDGKAPAKGEDLEVGYNYRGLLTPKIVYAWHAYVFSEVKDGLIQLYNPWGSSQPQPLTPEEFLTYFSNLNTNAVPQTAESKGST